MPVIESAKAITELWQKVSKKQVRMHSGQVINLEI